VARAARTLANRREQMADRLMDWISSANFILKRKDFIRSWAVLGLAPDYLIYEQIIKNQICQKYSESIGILDVVV
jgi:hypothetical protein